VRREWTSKLSCGGYVYGVSTGCPNQEGKEEKEEEEKKRSAFMVNNIHFYWFPQC